MNLRRPSRNVRNGMISAETNSTSTVNGSSKAHTRPTEAPAKTSAPKAGASAKATASAAVNTTATPAPAMRSGPNRGSERHRCNANY